MYRTLKWYFENDRDAFERLGSYAHDMPSSNPSRGKQWRQDFKRKTIPEKRLSWENLILKISKDLEQNESRVLEILKISSKKFLPLKIFVV